ncbi:hypothetical protein HJC23_001784 [Cyclotella cryptica]|uniref:Uncharacterized protein n=1 Tax=Cyclotella cryptica TaxID=29204 RepID=A0ABD3QPG4_9STRA
MTSPSTSKHCTQSHFRSPFRQYSECRVTTAVQSFSHHRATLHQSFYSPRHFPKFLATAMLCSGVVGYAAMEWYWSVKMEERAGIYVMAYNGSNVGIDSNKNADTLSSVGLARKMTFRANDVGFNNSRRVTQFW